MGLPIVNFTLIEGLELILEINWGLFDTNPIVMVFWLTSCSESSGRDFGELLSH